MTEVDAQTTPIFWRDDELVLLDQRQLPAVVEYGACGAKVVVMSGCCRYWSWTA